MAPVMIGQAVVLALSLIQGPSAAGGRPVDVYSALDGRWKGQFVGFDAQGKELYRIDVEQTYRTVDDHTQIVRIKDTDASGRTITGEGRNIARRRPDGSLELLCIVEKSNGDKVRHEGRLVRGADGSTQLIWFSVASGRTETFREDVRTVPGGEVYTIDGMGLYGGTPILMHGRYRRTK